MRKLLVTPIVALAVLLGSCAQLRDPSAPPITANTAIEFVKLVKGWAIQICGFEPALNVGSAVVAQLMSVYFPAGVALQAAAHAVGVALCESPDATVQPSARGVVGPAKIVQTPRGTIVVPGRYVGQTGRRR
jgi:hypothetical protein